ncbi:MULTISPECIES: carbohydrate ABC transporter permease [Streptomyces]|uniref:Sugar ABC transporter permease n=1 Tax=Streptomyces thermoviolaceus subsp. thermoviolaceus TaxID=66860 RepID=A0ABX0YPX2_STRTL|nr:MULTISPECIES: sugar ABC transporter permease [Streptomyces]MCM3263684.1 sugar ABC transporter permease [Streptomyces thermoviolaceus]NJP14605.1 sugar ABC transporter permease [Streptomyces thermoviolaceus subsp. thermoviolaceus]RSS07952.1 sugar ABC transporter permease [Streptomyces sp. WAC00469]WTD47849.1 sugar ABC transporter permease [Streptomyces thermoviolaceus]GGV74642.1 ABC transporter [Streptomyces thermoviolaceus subsp. apingens]
MTKSTTAVRKGRTGESARTGRPHTAWVLPGVLFFAFFAVAPMALAFYLSFTKWNGLGDPEPVGLANWEKLLQDPRLTQSLTVTVLLTVVSWAFQTVVSLLLGVWAAGRQRNRAFLSAVFFVPFLLSSTAISLLFYALLDPNFGIIRRDTLGTTSGAFLAIVFVGGWQFIPFHTLIYQGGARQIPEVLYQAAAMDGAGRYRQFFSITLPQLRNTMTTSSVLMIVGSLTYFETVLILTQGGPGTDTAILPYLMYEAGFKSYDFGYASALASFLVVAATALSLLLVRLSGFGAMRSTREGM